MPRGGAAHDTWWDALSRLISADRENKNDPLSSQGYPPDPLSTLIDIVRLPGATG
jgi:hypothetical protein